MSAEEIVVAPLDAYETAKPDEPTFTLQGGDPLAAPLVRLWAFFARRRAATARIDQEVFGEIIEAAIGHRVEHDDRERDNLLLRATAAEEVSWTMDAYAKGQVNADVPTEAADTHVDELQRIDLHDYRVRAAQRLNNAHGEVIEIANELKARGFCESAGYTMFIDIAGDLRKLNELVEPRRLFKKG